MPATCFLPSICYWPLSIINQFLLPLANGLSYVSFSQELEPTPNRWLCQSYLLLEFWWEKQNAEIHTGTQSQRHTADLVRKHLSSFHEHTSKEHCKYLSKGRARQGEKAVHATSNTHRGHWKCISFAVKTDFPFWGINLIKGEMMEGGGLVRISVYYFNIMILFFENFTHNNLIISISHFFPWLHLDPFSIPYTMFYLCIPFSFVKHPVLPIDSEVCSLLLENSQPTRDHTFKENQLSLSQKPSSLLSSHIVGMGTRSLSPTCKNVSSLLLCWSCVTRHGQMSPLQQWFCQIHTSVSLSGFYNSSTSPFKDSSWAEEWYWHPIYSSSVHYYVFCVCGQCWVSALITIHCMKIPL